MREKPYIGFLPDGRRLHMRDGPIELIVEAFGTEECVRAAYEAAARRFDGLLEELADELAVLRSPVDTRSTIPAGMVARRMYRAAKPFAATNFITPMAAVAGAVAEEILGAMTGAADLDRAYVNNGGDIALHLDEDESFSVALVDRPDKPGLFGKARISSADPSRGIATSGWRGRSFSLGIADAVTVMARSAAEADAAATMIANRVDLPGHPAVSRVPASSLQPDSDLKDMPVTREVGVLTADEIETALARGEAYAHELLARGLVHAVALHLDGVTRIVQPAPAIIRERMEIHA